MIKNNKIFISYANEDYNIVKSICNILKSNGFSPWIDKENIIPGERWENSIWSAVRHADFIIFCISKNSVNKRGFLQKEIKGVLELWKEKLEDDIYIIPIRLENINIPESLKQFQWIDYFNDKNCDKLINAINQGINRINNEKFELLRNEDSFITHKINESYNGIPQISIEVEYIKFKNDLYEEINCRLYSYILEKIHELRKYAADSLIGSIWKENAHTNRYDLNGLTKILFNNSKLLSLAIYLFEYNAGAAHGHDVTKIFNFSLQPVSELDLYDLFKEDDNFLIFISKYCRSILKIQAEYDSCNEKENFDWIEDGTKPEINNFNTFSINEKHLVITFKEYQVGPFSWGVRQVGIPFNVLRSNLNNSCSFFKLID